MQAITTIGLDIAKSVFQVHGVDEKGNVILVVSSSVATYWLSFKSSRRAWSVSKLVLRRITGRANCRHLATPFA
jgi:transposase